MQSATRSHRPTELVQPLTAPLLIRFPALSDHWRPHLDLQCPVRAPGLPIGLSLQTFKSLQQAEIRRRSDYFYEFGPLSMHFYGYNAVCL